MKLYGIGKWGRELCMEMRRVKPGIEYQEGKYEGSGQAISILSHRADSRDIFKVKES